MACQRNRIRKRSHANIILVAKSPEETGPGGSGHGQLAGPLLGEHGPARDRNPYILLIKGHDVSSNLKRAVNLQPKSNWERIQRMVQAWRRPQLLSQSAVVSRHWWTPGDAGPAISRQQSPGGAGRPSTPRVKFRCKKAGPSGSSRWGRDP